MARILNSQPNFPTEGNNADITLANSDQTGVTTSTETQIIRSVSFVRTAHLNAAGDVVRYEPWEVDNFPALVEIAPISVTIGELNEGLTIDVSSVGPDVNDFILKLLLPMEANYYGPVGAYLSDGSCAVQTQCEITSFVGSTLTFSADLRWREELDFRLKRPGSGTGELYLIVKASQL